MASSDLMTHSQSSGRRGATLYGLYFAAVYLKAQMCNSFLIVHEQNLLSNLILSQNLINRHRLMQIIKPPWTRLGLVLASAGPSATPPLAPQAAPTPRLSRSQGPARHQGQETTVLGRLCEVCEVSHPHFTDGRLRLRASKQFVPHQKANKRRSQNADGACLKPLHCPMPPTPPVQSLLR